MNLDAGNWRAIVAPYQKADVRRAVFQLLNTLVPLAALLYVMYLSLAWSYWLTLALAVPTAGFLIRTFIIMHDCGHGSFLPSQKWNNLVGWVTGVLTATPYAEWRHEHAIHHATAGDLDRRGHGDIATITVEEYLARDWWGRLRYRLYRHPALILGFGPLYLLIGQRFPGRVHSSGSPKTSSIWSTNLGMAVVITGLAMLIGIQSVLLVYLPVAYLAAGAGVYLFFVQHQFDQAYWEHHISRRASPTTSCSAPTTRTRSSATRRRSASRGASGCSASRSGTSSTSGWSGSGTCGRSSAPDAGTTP
jgi:omega-6 fatty acid desaturase (delta-12 desaturase)